MAVYERTYKRYTGEMTPRWSRFTVLPRYALKEVFGSRWFLSYFVLCFIPALVAGGWIYSRNNMAKLIPIEEIQGLMPIDADFFFFLLTAQASMAYVIALIQGPGLISKDLDNNGLPLYLSRPFSRPEYVLGKLSVLLALLSVVTWLTACLLVFFQSSLVKGNWFQEHSDLLFEIVVSNGIYIFTLSLLALAFSAWVRWRPVAAFMMLMVVLGGILFGNLATFLFEMPFLQVFNLQQVFRSVYGLFLGVEVRNGLSAGATVFAVVMWNGVSLFLLNWKLRAYEVVS
jgi:ABC-2 type transport system permease protein